MLNSEDRRSTHWIILSLPTCALCVRDDLLGFVRLEIWGLWCLPLVLILTLELLFQGIYPGWGRVRCGCEWSKGAFRTTPMMKMQRCCRQNHPKGCPVSAAAAGSVPLAWVLGVLTKWQNVSRTVLGCLWWAGGSLDDRIHDRQEQELRIHQCNEAAYCLIKKHLPSQLPLSSWRKPVCLPCTCSEWRSLLYVGWTLAKAEHWDSGGRDTLDLWIRGEPGLHMRLCLIQVPWVMKKLFTIPST